MFTIINIIIICKFHARVCSWLQDDTNSSVLCFPQYRVEADIQWYKIVLHAPGPESTLIYGVLLVFTIRSQVFSLPSAKLLDDHHLGKLWQRDRINITGLDDWCCQKKNTSLESHLLKQITITFTIKYFLKNVSKLQLRNMHFEQQQKSFLFIFLLFQI